MQWLEPQFSLFQVLYLLIIFAVAGTGIGFKWGRTNERRRQEQYHSDYIRRSIEEREAPITAEAVRRAEADIADRHARFMREYSPQS